VGDGEGSFSRQHDARFEASGDVSVFDDHSALPGAARGVEYALDLQAGTAKVVWEYRGPVSSTAMGSFRRYSSGSNLIAWGYSSAITTFDAAFTEVDDQGRSVMEVSFVLGDAAYRAVKLPVEQLDIDVLRATAGHP